MSEAAGVSFLAVGPEIALGLGAVLILLIDVARNPGPRVHAGLVALSLAAAAGLTVWQGAGGESGRRLDLVCRDDPLRQLRRRGARRDHPRHRPRDAGGVDPGVSVGHQRGRGSGAGTGERLGLHAHGDVGPLLRALPRARDRVDLALRACRFRQGVTSLRRGRGEVLPARVFRFGTVHLRGGARLRRDRRPRLRRGGGGAR